MADWRLTGQEKYLRNAEWVRKRYRAVSATSEHEHCEFCWAKFMAVPYASDQGILTEGFAVQGRSPSAEFPDDYWWVCPTCARDFADSFGWILVGGPPE